jgi:hypothetical protein
MTEIINELQKFDWKDTYIIDFIGQSGLHAQGGNIDFTIKTNDDKNVILVFKDFVVGGTISIKIKNYDYNGNFIEYGEKQFIPGEKKTSSQPTSDNYNSSLNRVIKAINATNNSKQLVTFYTYPKINISQTNDLKVEENTPNGVKISLIEPSDRSRALFYPNQKCTIFILYKNQKKNIDVSINQSNLMEKLCTEISTYPGCKSKCDSCDSCDDSINNERNKILLITVPIIIILFLCFCCILSIYYNKCS